MTSPYAVVLASNLSYSKNTRQLRQRHGIINKYFLIYRINVLIKGLLFVCNIYLPLFAGLMLPPKGPFEPKYIRIYNELSGISGIKKGDKPCPRAGVWDRRRCRSNRGRHGQPSRGVPQLE